MWEQWLWQIDDTIIFVALEEDIGFVGLFWYRSLGASKEEEVYRLFEAAPLAVGAGAVEVAGVEAKRPGFY